MGERDKNCIPINIYLDQLKASDMLDHNILTDKLSYYGINGIALQLFQNNLTDWKQFVEINYVKLDRFILKTGVAQGSILGPLQAKYFTLLYMLMTQTFLVPLNNTKKMKKQTSIETVKNYQLENIIISTWLKTITFFKC